MNVATLRMPDAGALDRRVTLHLPGPVTRTELGEEQPSVVSVETWAQVLPAGGTEVADAGQMVAHAQVVFVVRWRAGVTPLCRVTHDGREYDVVSVDEIGRREGLRITGRARAEARA